jgi:hypothetical protein
MLVEFDFLDVYCRTDKYVYDRSFIEKDIVIELHSSTIWSLLKQRFMQTNNSKTTEIAH